VLLNPAVLGKIATIYEHAFMLKADTPALKEKLLIDICRQYAQDDSALRYLRQALPHEEFRVAADPALYARIAIAHRWVCRSLQISPHDTEAQLRCGNGTNPITEELRGFLEEGRPRKNVQHMISNLRADAAVSCDSKLIIGESLFFQSPSDHATFDLSQYFLDCFERGIRNIEIPADLLPFDPSKRLPREIPEQETQRIRELASTLGQTITIHSPLVGPLHPKTGFNALLEDPADNPQILKDTIELAARLGAKTIVVHLSNRESRDAVIKYAEIVEHAIGKTAADGTPLRIAFENYMQKALPNKGKPFPTMSEHFSCFWEVLETVAERAVARQEDPLRALRHCALLLDSAHFNLVNDFDEDPVKSVLDLTALAPRASARLLLHPTVGPVLERLKFDADDFARHLVVQLHLNQNIGPIGFTIPGVDFSADLHLPVESSGTISNIAFVTLLRDAGFGGAEECGEVDLVILAEQRKKLDPAGLKTLYDVARDAPALDVPPGLERVKHYVIEGKKACERERIRNPDGYQRLGMLLHNADRTIREHYAYMAGRLGMLHLIDHLKRRASHHLLSAHVDIGAIDKLSGLPHLDASVTNLGPGEFIIHKGVSYQSAREQGENVFYLLLSGTAEVALGDKRLTLTPGTPFGEIMFLSGGPRTADVVAGPSGAKLLRIPESTFWDMFKLFAPLQERLAALLQRRTA